MPALDQLSIATRICLETLVEQRLCNASGTAHISAASREKMCRELAKLRASCQPQAISRRTLH